MPISVVCPSCKRQLRIGDHLAGKTIRCPSCQTAFPVQAEEEFPDVAVEEAPARPSRPAAPLPQRRPAPAADYGPGDAVEDDEGPEARPRKKKGGRALARQKVAAPAICLMVVGILGIVMALAGTAINLAMGTNPFAVSDRLAAAQDKKTAIVVKEPGDYRTTYYAIIVGIVQACWGGAVISGAMKMKGLQSYGYSTVGAILAMVPCNACCLLGVPIGIWCLITINSGDVRKAFG